MKTIRNLAILTVVAVTVYGVVKLIKSYTKAAPQENDVNKPAEDDFINSKNWN